MTATFTFPPGSAVVIGGSGGIGRAISIRLAQCGLDVAISYRHNRGAALALAEEIEAMGRRAHICQVSLASRSSVKDFFDGLTSVFDSLHSIVFAAGANISMPYVSQIDWAEWRAVIDSDLHGFFHVTEMALPLLRQNGGSITALSSAGVMRHPPRDILSTVPKAGIEALVRAIAREEGRHAIRANAVALGIVDAGLFQRLTNHLPQEFVDAMVANTALRRVGRPQEVADTVAFLSSLSAGYITGQSIAVDGGFSV